MRIDAQGVGIGEKDSVRPPAQDGVVNRDAVCNTGRMVADDDTSSCFRQTVQAMDGHVKVQKPGHIVHGLRAAERLDGVGHGHRLAIAQNTVKHWLRHRPDRRFDQARRALVDQFVDNMKFPHRSELTQVGQTIKPLVAQARFQC